MNTPRIRGTKAEIDEEPGEDVRFNGLDSPKWLTTTEIPVQGAPGVTCTTYQVTALFITTCHAESPKKKAS